ncbi:glutamate 5-kinase [Moorella sp. Hama-1]|uniref:glutamate 5-kinase n=1 Tax=Moorella sp. Hama-1 TaxID=2138101 RepID=UPI000D649027|nr:glutamate 5-kinase [Moorella sp. Hama-1]BCV20487.1 glutamate 5-kinase [Moorella sp. Hama-1]
MTEEECRQTLSQARRLVVKVGTSTLTHKTGKLNLERMERLVRELVDQVNAGRQVVLVTSGAVGAGMGRLGLKEKPRTLPEKQAAAAVGQGLLMHMYEKFFSDYGLLVAQVLLTRDDLADRTRYLNSRHTLAALLRHNVIPVVNENDTVAVEEIRVGDNDTLSALVAGLIDADILFLLTDTGGLFTANPATDAGACLLPCITEITPEVEALAGGAGSTWSTGGMATKIQAARLATSFGIPVVIASGIHAGQISSILRGEEVGTIFLPREHRAHTRKRWLAYAPAAQGQIQVDAGAARAICKNGKSLLPGGVTAVVGDFEQGAVVSIVDPAGKEIARGMTNYPAAAISRIKGRKTGEIGEILGYKDYDEIVHRDNLIVLG